MKAYRTARYFLSFFLLVAVVSIGSQQPAVANNAELNRAYDRIERLEKDLNMLQQQVYRGGKGGEGGPPPAVATGDTEALMEQIRLLNGRIEELDHANRVLKENVDRLNADIDFRFKQVEGKNQAVNTSTHQGQNEHQPTKSLDKPDSPASQSLGTVKLRATENTSKDIQEEPSKTSLTDADKVAPIAKDTSKVTAISDAYDNAFTLLKQSKYKEAEAAFKKFVESNPREPLTGNAYYWLGETYFVQKIYDKASLNYLKGYKQFPKGKKAADSLYKLAMSLDRLKKTKEACSTLARLQTEFPLASDTLKAKTKELQGRLQCNAKK